MSIEESIQENAESISELSRIVYMLAEGREIAASDLPSGWWGREVDDPESYIQGYTWYGTTSVQILRKGLQPSRYLNGARVVIVPESAVPEWARKQGV